MYPFQPDTDRLLAQGPGHRFSARAIIPGRADPLELAPLSVTYGWDARRAPRLQGTASCVVPPGQADLDALDPRTLTRVELTAGYVRPGGVEDVHTQARALLTDRRVGRPADTMELAFSGDERLVVDDKALGVVVPNQVSVAAAARDLVELALPYAPAWADALPYGVPEALVMLTEGGDYWALVDDLVDRVNGDIWHDGLDTWHLAPRPTLTTPAAAVLRVGEGGTITASDTALSRGDGWANTVLLTYAYDDAGDTVTVYGNAWVEAGPYDIDAVGRVVYAERRTVRTALGDAHAAAAALLWRRLAQGRTFRVSALARYWLRPGHTVTVRLPSGGQERLLVVAATFHPLQGLMDLELALPDDVSTITTGG